MPAKRAKISGENPAGTLLYMYTAPGIIGEAYLVAGSSQLEYALLRLYDEASLPAIIKNTCHRLAPGKVLGSASPGLWQHLYADVTRLYIQGEEILFAHIQTAQWKIAGRLHKTELKKLNQVLHVSDTISPREKNCFL